MAYRQVVLLLALFLTVSDTSASTSRRLLHNNVIPNSNRKPQADIAGVVRCFIPAWEPKSEPLVAGVDVIVTCDGGRTVVGEAVTNTDGFFQITANTVEAVVFGKDSPGPCRAGLRTPIAGCAVYPPTGVLEETDLPIVDELLGHGHGHGQDHDNVAPYENNVVAYESNPHAGAGQEAYNYEGYQHQP